MNAEPSKVVIVKERGEYQLLVNDEPFNVKGVGLGSTGFNKIVDLKAAGANAFRTWTTRRLDKELAAAQELGLMVAVGLETGKELVGFDYDDEAAVAAQYAKMTSIIDKYKNHPNILCWVIANEPNLLFDQDGKDAQVNPKVYDALADITDYIHKVDPNHPVTFAFAGAGKDTVQSALKRIPQIDIISVQLYGNLGELSGMIDDIKIDKPYMVTETSTPA